MKEMDTVDGEEYILHDLVLLSRKSMTMELVYYLLKKIYNQQLSIYLLCTTEIVIFMCKV